MLKKRNILIVVLAVIGQLAFASLNLEAETQVNSVTLSWDEVNGADYYDIYNGDVFVVRLGSDVFSYTLSHLDQDETYRFVMGARDSANATLDADAVTVRTGDYSATYLWTNPTDDDNKGRLKEIRYKAELAEDKTYGQYMRISIIEDGQEHVIFPLADFNSASWDWIDYDADSPAAIAYRLNCEKFNTMGIKPGKFKVDSVTLDNDSICVTIRTSALGISVETVSTYEFGCDEEGRFISFTTTGSGLAKSALFKNPADRENPYTYILREV